MKFYNSAIILIILFSLLFTSCEKEEVHSPSKPFYELRKAENIPEFNPEEAYAYIEKQVSFGPRNPGSTGHAQTLNYLRNELSRYADEVQLQNFNYSGYDENLFLTNIIGKFNPAAKNRILLAAHWDTRPRAEEATDTSKQNLPVLGANDGASGVGVLLEIASLLKQNKPDYGIDIVFFDGEDYGRRNDLSNYCLGAKYFSANLPNDYKPAFGILLDMIGDKDAFFPREGHSRTHAGDVLNMVWNAADIVGASSFVDTEASEIYDDHVPLNQAGIRTIDIIDLELIGADTPDARRNYWHTDKDVLENIGKETLGQVGKVLTYVLYSLKFNY